MLPILNIQKSITNIVILVFFFLLAQFSPVFAQSCGTPYYGTADGDLLSGAGCTIGLQSPSISKECASCNVKNMPGFRDFFVNNGMGQCNNLQIMNYWVHGGMGAAGPHNFYEGDIAPHICKCVCTCELADRNANCADSVPTTVPTTKPTLIPTSIPTPIPTMTPEPTLQPTLIPTVAPQEDSSPTPYYEAPVTNIPEPSQPDALPFPTEKQLKTSTFMFNWPKFNILPKITLPDLDLGGKSAVVIRFFTSIFDNFFKEASF